MSRIGSNPVTIEEGVTVQIDGHLCTVSGPLGTLEREFPRSVFVAIEDGKVVVTSKGSSKQARSDFGTTRALIATMVEGVKNGFKKELELVGMGYRASMQGQTLVLNIGLNHPVKIDPSDGVTLATPDEVTVAVSGTDKQKVGLWAAKIRAVRKPEPYKGKGIRYKDEIVRRKESKAVKESAS